MLIITQAQVVFSISYVFLTRIRCVSTRTQLHICHVVNIVQNSQVSGIDITDKEEQGLLWW
jgi:hypothetical protein